MSAELFQNITVSGFYDDLTGNPLTAVIGATFPSPANGFIVVGYDSTDGFAHPLSVTANGYLNVNASITPPSDNTATGSITSTQAVTVSTAGTSAVMIQVSGTWTGTLNDQASIDGTTYNNIVVYPVLPDGTPGVSSITANGFWTIYVGGFQKIQVIGNTVATGSASVYLTAGQGQYSVEVNQPVAANLNATVVGTHTNNAAVGNGSFVNTLPAIATSAAPAYTNNFVVALSTDLAGNLRVTSSGTTTVAGSLTNNNAAPTNNNLGVLGFIAETAYNTVTYTTGDQVLAVTDLHGAINTDLQAVAGVALGATAVTNFGTAPAAAAVQGVNASIYTAGAAIATANPLFTNISDGTNALTANAITAWGTAPTGHVLGVNSEMFAGNTALTATGSSLNVNITGSSGNTTVVGTLTNNNAAPAANNVGVLPAIAVSGAFPAVTIQATTAGDQELLTVSQGGSLITIPADEQYASHIGYFADDSGFTTLITLANATLVPLISIQSNSAAISFLIREVDGYGDGSQIKFVLVKNPQTLTGAAFTATGIPTGSHIKRDVTATAVTIGTGTVVWSGMGAASPAHCDQLLQALAAGAPGDTFTFAAQKFGTGSSKAFGSIRWSEETAAI